MKFSVSEKGIRVGLNQTLAFRVEGEVGYSGPQWAPIAKVEIKMIANLRVVFSFICVFLLTSPLHVLSQSPWGCAFRYDCKHKKQVGCLFFLYIGHPQFLIISSVAFVSPWNPQYRSKLNATINLYHMVKFCTGEARTKGKWISVGDVFFQVIDQFELPETSQLEDQPRPLREFLSKPFEGRLSTARRLRTRQELEA